MNISTKNQLKLWASTSIILGSLVSPSLTYADDTDEKKEEVSIVKVISVETGDWNEDENMDSAVLMQSDDIVELYLYLGNKEGEQEEVLHKTDVVWSGTLEGSIPYLEPKKKSSSLFIYSQNDSVGRSRWHQRITISYRDKNFRVTGYTYDEMDTLDPDNGFSCDLNVATGKGVRDKKEFKLDAQKIKLEDWTEENIPEQCSPDEN